MKDVYEELVDGWDLDLVKIVNEMDKPLRRVTLYFVFYKGITCEIKLRYGEQRIQKKANTFLYHLSNSATPDHFIHSLYQEFGRLAENGLMYNTMTM